MAEQSKKKDCNPSISIAIPTRNRPEVLRKAIESCLSQEYPNFEIVIAENSDDDTASKGIIDAFHDERINYIINKRK